MKTGKVIEGRVSHVEKKDQDWFYVDDGETKYIPVDMKKVDEWVYNEDVCYRICIDEMK